MKHERYVVERRKGINWEPFGFPMDDLEEAKKCLEFCEKSESKKRYKADIRLVRETRETIQI